MGPDPASSSACTVGSSPTTLISSVEGIGELRQRFTG